MLEAVRGQHGDILNALLKHGERGDFGGMGSALHQAVLSGRGDFVNVLSLRTALLSTPGIGSEMLLFTLLRT